MQRLIDMLDKGGYSCVIARRESARSEWQDIRHFSMRGIADLHRLRSEEIETLRGAYIADKVVGKGAAAIMVSCDVKRLFTHVISEAAYELLRNAGVEVEFGVKVHHIINRDRSGWCPVEWRCRDTDRVEDILPIIDSFIAEMNQSR